MALRPTQETLRLRHVQHVAKRLLALADDGNSFGASDVCEGLHHVQSTSSEYLWRMQLPWAWWRAGWLEQSHDGARARYALKEEGRAAIETIAEDEIVASYYVHTKRSTNAGARALEWFQAPQLRAVPNDGEETEDEPAEDALVAASILRGTHAEDGTQDEGGEDDDATGAVLGQLAQYLERSSAAIEQVAARVGKLEEETARISAFIADYSSETMQSLGHAIAVAPEVHALVDEVKTLKKESDGQSQRLRHDLMQSLGHAASVAPEVHALADQVKTLKKEIDGQSQLVLDVASKFDGAQERLGKAAGEIVSAVARHDDGSLKRLAERFDRHEQFHTQMAAEVTRMVDRNKLPDEARVTAALKAALEPALEKAVAVAMKEVRAEVRETMERATMDFTKPLTVACEAIATKLEVYDIKYAVTAIDMLNKGMERTASAIASVSETYRANDAHWSERANSARTAMMKTLDDARTVMTAVMEMCQELISLTTDVVRSQGVPRAVIAETMAQIQRRRDAVEDGVQGVTAMGAGLLNPNFTVPYSLPAGEYQPMPDALSVSLGPAKSPEPGDEEEDSP